jgi:MYXO-CTERM domain-containing protein
MAHGASAPPSLLGIFMLLVLVRFRRRRKTRRASA